MCEIQNFFKGKKVFITGHTGFKGTWLTLLLVRMRAIICGFSLPVEEGSFYAGVTPEIYRHVEGDINNRELLKSTIVDFKPDIVIHFASHSSLKQVNELSEYILETNIMGVVRLFEAVRIVNTIKAVLIVTSDKCYKNNEATELYGETDPLGAMDPYSTSKACQELISECYYKFFLKPKGIGVATARASNVIGGGDYNLTRLLPSLLDSFNRGVCTKIRNPHSIRPWQNILDVLYGYLLLVKSIYESANQCNKYCSAFNFGPKEDGIVSVLETVEELIKHFPEGRYEIQRSEMENSEVQVLRLDSSKAFQMLHWKPKFSFASTIEMAAEFSKRAYKGEAVKGICLEYIEEYLMNFI